MKKRSLCVLLLLLALRVSATELWERVAEPGSLPRPERSGYARVNGVKLYYAVFGKGEPLVLLHGGLASSDYWANQVPELRKHFQVIVIESRAHDRLAPTPNDEPAFVRAIGAMWQSEPHYTREQLRHIPVPTAIADGEHDEAIKPSHTREMADLIPGARLILKARDIRFANNSDHLRAAG